MCEIEDIIKFVKDETLAKRVTENSDIENDLGWTGDDFTELMEKYSEQFNVNMTSYLWYFHHNEEPSFNFGGLFFKSPRQRVKHIPVTPKLLLMFAEKGKWELDYPKHELPKIRYDILINQIVFALYLVFAAWFIIWKYF